MNHSAHRCKNCDNVLTGKYCHTCGQSAETPAVGAGFIAKEFRQTFISFNNGFFYTVGHLISGPGTMVREYLAGRRIRHMRPFLLLSTGTYAYCYHYLGINLFDGAANDGRSFNAWYLRNITWLQLSQLAASSAASTAVFGRHPVNFPQFVIANTYLTGFRMLVGIGFLPLHLIPFMRQWHAASFVTGVVGIVYLYLMYRELFPSLSPAGVLLRTAAVYLLMLVLAVSGMAAYAAVFGGPFF